MASGRANFRLLNPLLMDKAAQKGKCIAAPLAAALKPLGASLTNEPDKTANTVQGNVMARLKFGAFLAPHHPLGEHPML